MARTGFDFFISEPNSTDEKSCRVCGSKCRVTRNVFGPTGFASAVAKKFSAHDEAVCPHTDETWHDKALQLAVAIDETPSKRLEALMRADLDDLLQENLG